MDIEASDDSLNVGIPQQLFQVPFQQVLTSVSVFDVTADGQRFVVNTVVAESISTRINWVLNWMADVEQ